MSDLRMASFRLTPETIERLRCLAALEHRSMAGQLEHLIARSWADASRLAQMVAAAPPTTSDTLERKPR